MSACTGGPTTPPAARARNVVLVTVDTLRADRVGAYGYAAARTPVLDALARDGVVFDRAYAAAPITLPSHATVMTGRYPPGHGARDNGIRVRDGVATLAAVLNARGFRTAAFVGAFPLDHQFGLGAGFEVYGDRMPRQADGRLASERPGDQVVGDAVAWLRSIGASSPAGAGPRYFLWVHLFEPHAPYAGDPSQPASARYDEEIARADRALKPLLDAVDRQDTLVVFAGDHGEAFGEHGEISHSIFVYDTTLRVPLVVSGPGIGRATRAADPVTLADLAPTIARAVGAAMPDVDGVDLAPALRGEPLAARELYAESFAPLVEFGWAPLRALRADGWKYIAAPRPELYDVGRDPGESADRFAEDPARARRLDARVGAYSSNALAAGSTAVNDEAAARLRALGYTAGTRADTTSGDRPDPKDRRELAAQIARVTSGELQGAALVNALEAIVRDDPRNGQARLRLGYARLAAGDCRQAEREFSASLASGLQSADAYLGLAQCQGRRSDLAAAGRSLAEARRLEPDNPVIAANLGILEAARGNAAAAVPMLQQALAADPGLHEARFNLALALARAGKRVEAAAQARELLSRLPPSAPQRAEVERLVKSLE